MRDTCWFFFGCDSEFQEIPVADICPVSCDACDDEGGEEGITDGCDLPDLNIYLGDNGEVFYNSSEDIYGFQFYVDGATVSAPPSEGDALDAGFTVSGTTTILGFSFTGSFVPAGCGVLVELDLDGEATGLSDIVMSGQGGTNIDFSYYGDESDPDAGCTDESACNYDEDALTDDGSCDYA